MSKLSLVRIPESQLVTPATGEYDTRLNGRIAAQFLNKSNSELTRKNYLSNLRQFVLFSGRKDAQDVQVEDVLAWRDSMINKGFAPHTIETKLATLSALFSYFRDYGIIDRNPATVRLVPRPEKPLQSPKGKSLSVKEVRYLLYSVHRDNPLDLRDFAIIYLILRTSLRVSEVCQIKVSDIKRDGSRPVIDYKSKGGKRLRQPLPKDVKQVIDDYLEADRRNRKDSKTDGADAYIFQADVSRRIFGENAPLTSRHIWHIVKRRGELAGLGKLAPHDLRRTAITKAFRQNASLTSILNMSKHKSVETLMIYNKELDNLENNAVYEIDYDTE